MQFHPGHLFSLENPASPGPEPITASSLFLCGPLPISSALLAAINHLQQNESGHVLLLCPDRRVLRTRLAEEKNVVLFPAPVRGGAPGGYNTILSLLDRITIKYVAVDNLGYGV